MSTLPTQPPQEQKPSQDEVLPTQSVTQATADIPAGWNATKQTSEYIKLPDGKELNEVAAMALAKSRPVQWIVLAGPVDAGKTTLLASLYELFQWRRVERYAFAGSNTLPAFEEKCYWSRKGSGNVTPRTQRTRFEGLDDPRYLHLRVRSTEGLRPVRDFLFTDVSGELFKYARDSTDDCKKMVFLKRANSFLLLLDSEKGVQKDRRWEMFEDARALLRSCVDSQMIGANCVVSILWSRFDYFEAKKADDAHRIFREDVERRMRETFSRHISKLVFSEVAARPLEAPDLGFGYGVPSLLTRWAASPVDSNSPDLLPQSYSGERESELFGARHFASVTANEESGS
jgi:hypothetical protein